MIESGRPSPVRSRTRASRYQTVSGRAERAAGLWTGWAPRWSQANSATTRTSGEGNRSVAEAIVGGITLSTVPSRRGGVAHHPSRRMLYGGSAGGRQNRRAQHSRPAAGGARHGTRTPGCARVRTAGGARRRKKQRPGGGGGEGGPTRAGGGG